MQFKHPEFLYALFALIIPIIIHLFQLRRFQKVPFTNVDFLKSVAIQTRKSSQLKKWLTLLARILALSALIVAFAQPFFSAKNLIGKKDETVIYLDNSFSMQAKGSRGPLLQRAVQELLSHLSEEETISLFTNTETFRNVTKNDIQNDLLQLGYTANQLGYEAAYLKARQLFSSGDETERHIVLISDFQQKKDVFELPSDRSSTVDLVQLLPVNRQNLAVDSLDLVRNAENQLMLTVLLSNSGKNLENVSVGLYDKEKLMGKTSVSIPENGTASTQFRIEENKKVNGKVVLEDPALTFDNTRYFTINAPDKIKVLAINQANDDFIKRIFTQDEFILTSTSLKSLNYNDINTSNFIILNELNEIPLSLSNALKTFKDQGGSLCFIPARNGSIGSYQQFLSNFGSLNLMPLKSREKKITNINFSHPLYRGVFDKKVSNFQYPKVNSYFPTDTGNGILWYEDKSPFLYNFGNIYVFTASLDKENSNFKNSPIIVPTLYNMGRQSLQLSDISYTIGKVNTYDIPVNLGQDGILTLVSGEERVIPMQQNFANKVKITTEDVPATAGIYNLQEKDNILQNVSYNYDTEESNLRYYNLSSNTDYIVSDTVASYFDKVKEENSVNELWKWFIIFALVFVSIEILLLKYLP